jgi:hypothetical protein
MWSAGRTETIFLFILVLECAASLTARHRLPAQALGPVGSTRAGRLATARTHQTAASGPLFVRISEEKNIAHARGQRLQLPESFCFFE